MSNTPIFISTHSCNFNITFYSHRRRLKRAGTRVRLDFNGSLENVLGRNTIITERYVILYRYKKCNHLIMCLHSILFIILHLFGEYWQPASK